MNGNNQFLVRGRDKIGKINIFHPMPARFDRIQLRRVRRKPLKLKPVRVFQLEIGRRRMMSRKVVPQDQHLAAYVMMEFREIKNEVLRVRRSQENCETKFQEMAAWSSRDAAKARMIMSARRFAKDGSFPDGSPGAIAIRDKRIAAFIPDTQRPTVFVRFFLMRGHSCFRQRSTTV